METSVRELTNQLPYVVRDKLRYYLDYVNDRLIDTALEEGLINRLEEVRTEAELIFFLRLLYGYFVVGFQNYERMLNYLSTKEIDGFRIGRTVFAERTAITYQWEQMAEALERLVDEADIRELVVPTTSVREVIRHVLASLSDEELSENGQG